MVDFPKVKMIPASRYDPEKVVYGKEMRIGLRPEDTIRFDTQAIIDRTEETYNACTATLSDYQNALIQAEAAILDARDRAINTFLDTIFDSNRRQELRDEFAKNSVDYRKELAEMLISYDAFSAPPPDPAVYKEKAGDWLFPKDPGKSEIGLDGREFNLYSENQLNFCASVEQSLKSSLSRFSKEGMEKSFLDGVRQSAQKALTETGAPDLASMFEVETLSIARFAEASRPALMSYYINQELNQHFIVVGTDQESHTASEWKHARTFLSALEQMVQEIGVRADTQQMLENNDRNHNVYGGQTILMRVDFESMPMLPEAIYTDMFSASESTTQYKLYYGFKADAGDVRRATEKYALNVLEQDAPYRVPVQFLDNRLFTAMEGAGVPQNLIDIYTRNFLGAADLAGHDPYHAVTVPYAANADYVYDFENIKNERYGSKEERQSLSIWAEILERLNKNERRKSIILDKASESFGIIADIQEHMLKQAGTDPLKRQEAINVGTYLAEGMGHRFFRVISPHSPALAESPRDGHPSVLKALDRIILSSPEDKCLPIPNESRHGLTALLENYAHLFPEPDAKGRPVYVDIHEDRTLATTAREGDTPKIFTNIEVFKFLVESYSN